MKPISNRHRPKLHVIVAAIYLAVFILHDINTCDLHCLMVAKPSEDTVPALEKTSIEDGTCAAEHNCPFCNGFVDTHVTPSDRASTDAVSRVVPSASSLPDYTHVQTRRSRDPPSALCPASN